MISSIYSPDMCFLTWNPCRLPEPKRAEHQCHLIESHDGPCVCHFCGESVDPVYAITVGVYGELVEEVVMGVYPDDGGFNLI